MAAGIASGDYQVEHIAAVTFTRKAAAELRGRSHCRIMEALDRVEMRRLPETKAT
jgi:ATP-dependent exoDNAse (exonuclease V) beta subunit